MARLGDVFSVIRNGASIKQTDGAGGFPIQELRQSRTEKLIETNLVMQE